MVTITAKVVACRFDEMGDPDMEKHRKFSRGTRNVPVLTASGNPAVDEDGKPKIDVHRFAHVHLRTENGPPFFLEMSEADAAPFEIGKEVTLTIALA